MTDERDVGQVSEVGRLAPDEAGNDPISPEDATAGAPEGESGRPEEGEAGPDAVPTDNRRDVEGKTPPGADKTP